MDSLSRVYILLLMFYVLEVCVGWPGGGGGDYLVQFVVFLLPLCFSCL